MFKNEIGDQMESFNLETENGITRNVPVSVTDDVHQQSDKDSVGVCELVEPSVEMLTVEQLLKQPPVWQPG